MFNSQYYTCEQIDQRLLQGYVDDYNNNNSTNLTKSELLTALYNFLTQGLRTGDIVQEKGNNTNKIMSQKAVSEALDTITSLVNEGSSYIGILVPSSNPGNHSAKVFAFANQKGTYTNLLDSGGNPIVIPIEGLNVLNYTPAQGETPGYWTCNQIYRSDRVFDGGRADTVYGGARSIVCGGAADN